MLDDEQLAACALRALAKDVIDVRVGTSGAGSENDHYSSHRVPEKEFLDDGKNAGHCRELELEVAQKINGNHPRKPVTGGKIMDKAVQYDGAFFQVHALLLESLGPQDKFVPRFGYRCSGALTVGQTYEAFTYSPFRAALQSNRCVLAFPVKRKVAP